MAITDNLEAYWNLDEASGTILDSTDNNVDSASESVTYGATGVLNDCLDFEKTSSNNINFGNVAAFDFEGTDAFSVSAWIKMESKDSTNSIVSKNYSGSPNNYGWEFAYDVTRLAIFINGSGGEIGARQTVSLDTGTWYHVTLTYDGGNAPSGFKFYVGDTLQSSPDTFGTTSSSSAVDAPLEIGARNSAINFFDGLIDEVAVFSREITGAEVTTLDGDGTTPPAYPFVTGPTVSTVSINESLGLSETLSVEHVRPPLTFTETISETTVLSETLSLQHVPSSYSIGLEESFKLSEELTVQHVGAVNTVPISESFKLSEEVSVLRVARSYSINIAETTSLVDSLVTDTFAQIFTITINESTLLSEDITVNHIPSIYARSISESLGLSENLSVSLIHEKTTYSRSIYDGLNLSDTLEVIQAAPVGAKPNYLAQKFLNGFNGLIDQAGKTIGVRYFNKTTGSVYDDDLTLAVSKTLWTSGIIFPLDNSQGSTDSILMEQGKLINADKRLYVIGSLSFTGSENTVKIIIGSPDGDAYTTIPDGGIMQTIGCTPIYKKQYIRKLTTGSLNGEY